MFPHEGMPKGSSSIKYLATKAFCVDYKVWTFINLLKI